MVRIQIRTGRRCGNRRALKESRSYSEEMGSAMLVGAVIAGLLIVSLFLEMVSSSPKAQPDDETAPTA
jgi:hypothetical protein